MNYVFIQKIALVFGVSGHDGAYVSEFLLNKGYEVRCEILLRQRLKMSVSIGRNM